MQEHAEGPRSKPLTVCPQCGARNPPTASVCKKCETVLRGTAANTKEGRSRLI